MVMVNQASECWYSEHYLQCNNQCLVDESNTSVYIEVYLEKIKMCNKKFMNRTSVMQWKTRGFSPRSSSCEEGRKALRAVPPQ